MDTSKEVFIEIPNKKHANQMMELLSKENMRSIYDDKASMPELDEDNVDGLKHHIALGDKMRCYNAGRTTNDKGQTSEDRATQPMDAGG